VLALGALDFGLEQSIVLPALPRLAEHYGTSILGATWLAVGFILASAVAVPLFGRLGDIAGKRGMILVSLGLFTAGSLLCALSSSIGPAIAGRVLQGLGAAIVPLTLGLARDTVPPGELARVVGIVLGAAAVGSGLGFFVSGALVDLFSPAAIFWFLAATGTVLGISVALLAPESPVRAPAKLDLPGALLLGLGLGALLLALSQAPEWGWTDRRVHLLCAVAAGALAAFGLTERRRAEPLVDPKLVTTRPFVNADLCVLAFGFAFFVAIYAVPRIATGLGLSVTEIGLVLVPTSVAALLGSVLGGRAIERVGPRVQVPLGAIIGALGYGSLAAVHDTALALTTGSMVIGFAQGLILTGIYPVVLRSAGVDQTSIAASVIVVARNVGLAFGVMAAATMIAEAGYSAAFLLAAGSALLVALLAAWLPERVT
jgi:MFS family permease